MNLSSTALWHYARRSVFPPLPPEHRAGFARRLAYANWLHAAILAPIGLAMNLCFGLLPEFHYYANGYWSLDGVHLTLTLLHVFMIVFSGVALVVLLRCRPETGQEGGRRHQRLALSYVCVMFAAITLFSVAEQQLTQSISAYLLGAAGFSTLFYTTPRFSFWTFFLSLAGLVLGSLWLQAGSTAMWHHLFIGLHAAVIFWGGSRLVYSLKVANYLQLVRIEAQARELAASNAELAQANRFKSDLLSCAAHDLRNPLHTISLLAQTVREELPSDSTLQPLAAEIDGSARRLAEFVGNLLTSDAAEAVRLQLERVPTPLPEFITAVVEQNRSRAARKAIALHVRIDEPARHAPAALLDPVRFRQVVDNLLTNAIKFSPSEKNVWIELTHRAGAGHQLVVRDEGPGLSAEDRRHLFGKYQRLSARPTHGEASSGLGLFIVHRLVTLHGGQVHAESDGPGRGARFIVTMPSS